MRGAADVSKFTMKPFTASAVLGASQIKTYGEFLCETQGINLTATPVCNDLNGREFMVVNGSSGWVTVDSAGDDFVGGLRQIVVGPNEAALLEYGKSSTLNVDQLVVPNRAMPKAFASREPTLAWTTHDATVTSNTQQYAYYDGICVYSGKIVCSDGNDGTQVTVDLPFVPQYLGAKVFGSGIKTIDTTTTECLPYVAADQATEANRKLTLALPATFTDTKGLTIEYSGWYPVHGFATYTPTLAWDQSTAPASLTTVAFYRIIDGLCWGVFMTSSADNNAATGLTFTTPEGVPVDTDAYVAAACGVLSNATWSNGMAYVDCANATAASRLVTFPTNSWPTMTDTEAMAAAVAFVFEMEGGVSFSSNMSRSFTTGTPASLTVSARHKVVDSEWCWFEVYMTSADSNGATNLAFKPPVVPVKTTNDWRLNCYVLNNATVVAAKAYLDSNQTDPDDRLVRFTAHPTCTDAATVTYRISGFYKVAG